MLSVLFTVEVDMSNTLSKVSKGVVNFVNNEEAASAVEYGLLAALIAAVIIAALRTLGTNLTKTFTTVSGALP